MSELLVGIGEFRVAKGNFILKTIGLGSCVGVALYDPIAKVGGLAHVVLPQSNGLKRSAKYADQAIEIMVESMERLGARRRNLIAKMAGGAQIFKHMTHENLRIGDRNVDVVKKQLENFGIRLVSEDVGGSIGRSVYFYVIDGKMLVRYSNGVSIWI
ncbi:chemotaxis protein CheD [Archaeoglobus profundus]|uniref:Probable chemoreceptor glutamine deamidase CheD n=1 Tax=Archaeoglobus profundus (strain DSM 5631 / JCM 9629 / NBRC 100127 / Av18) TaxID=572546 RepID=D2RE77_ARCPA|nr:chemotaxis protein CheD [Archaeoglobus profundus]ADB58421.1 CheD, stimulates methylation of MCP protein [Archaeoglobus profundus DSM 5631]